MYIGHVCSGIKKEKMFFSCLLYTAFAVKLSPEKYNGFNLVKRKTFTKRNLKKLKKFDLKKLKKFYNVYHKVSTYLPKLNQGK